MTGLSVSRLVNVTIQLSALAAAGRSFGVLMIAGDSNVINGAERFRSYDDIDGVTADFGVNAPETQAAELYFGQVPQPSQLMIGRWIRVATAAENIGAILSPSQQVIQNWNSIASGGFDITIDGTAQILTGLDFTGQTNLNGVASVITAALSAGATCVWDGTEFSVISGSTGTGVKASGTITLGSNPANLDTLTVDGTLITFVTGTPTGSEVKIGGTNLVTLANLSNFLIASVDVNISKANYSLLGTVITVTYKSTGPGGNAFTLAKSSTAITLSGSTLTGGVVTSSIGYATSPASGTDISAQLGLTALTSQAIVQGYDAETPVECAAVLADMSSAWYGLMFQASVQPTDQQNLDVCAFIEAQDVTRIFGVTITNTNALSALVTNDLGSLMQAGGYEQCFNQYSQNPYAIASIFGRAFSVDFTAENSVINLMFKQEPGVVAEVLSAQQADTLKAKRINVYATYDNDTEIIQYGVMSANAYIDEIQGLDWFQNHVQTLVYNVLYTTPTKIPQTDAGTNQLTNACSQACSDAVFNGLAGPGTWEGPSFGQLNTGDFLKSGFYIFSQPIALQSQSDRQQRLAPPIQIALQLAGAIDKVNVLVTVNR